MNLRFVERLKMTRTITISTFILLSSSDAMCPVTGVAKSIAGWAVDTSFYNQTERLIVASVTVAWTSATNQCVCI